jgi:transcriptional regulator with XRE-family HTH domain
MVGISPTFLSKVETGEFDPPKALHIKTMAALLGADADELLALAGKVDPDLGHIILGEPKAMADFLRSARGLTAEQLAKLAEQARRERDQEPDQP